MSGQFISGPLPADVSNVLHVYPSYTFNNKLRLGANFSWASGVPRTSLLAHPIYQNSGEIPGINPTYAYWASPGGGPPTELRKTKNLSAALTDPEATSGAIFLYSYDPVKRGNLGRTPDLVNFDVHADYPFDFGKSKMTLMLDVFNLFQTQEATAFEDTIELTAGVTDPLPQADPVPGPAAVAPGGPLGFLEARRLLAAFRFERPPQGGRFFWFTSLRGAATLCWENRNHNFRHSHRAGRLYQHRKVTGS